MLCGSQLGPGRRVPSPAPAMGAPIDARTTPSAPTALHAAPPHIALGAPTVARTTPSALIAQWAADSISIKAGAPARPPDQAPRRRRPRSRPARRPARLGSGAVKRDTPASRDSRTGRGDARSIPARRRTDAIPSTRPRERAVLPRCTRQEPESRRRAAARSTAARAEHGAGENQTAQLALGSGPAARLDVIESSPGQRHLPSIDPGELLGEASGRGQPALHHFAQNRTHLAEARCLANRRRAHAGLQRLPARDEPILAGGHLEEAGWNLHRRRSSQHSDTPWRRREGSVDNDAAQAPPGNARTHCALEHHG